MSKVVFLLLIFLLPTQLGKHFWPSWSLVNGVRVDYLAPTIYLTDILIFFLFLLTILQKIRNSKFETRNKSEIPNRNIKSINLDSRFRGNDKKGWLIFLIALGVLLAANFLPLSLIKSFKIVEIVVFAWLVKIYLTRKTYPQFIFILSLSLLFQSGLAIAQFFNHGSINGIFYWLGERAFTGISLGIANASINGQLILRPYGTFSHPNVLAGFLLIGIILICRVHHVEPLKKIFYLCAVTISSLALFLTLSRVAILLWVVFFIIYFFQFKTPKKFFQNLTGQVSNFKLLLLICVVAVVFVFLEPRFFSIFGEDKESYTARVEQSQIALAMWRDHPLFGVGLNQYLVHLPKYMKITSFKDYQPVHNVFLLVLSETGILGFLLVCWLMYKLLHRSIAPLLKNKDNNEIMKQWNNRYFLIFIFLILSLFDHYFYTLQQGNLMVGLIIGLCASKF